MRDLLGGKGANLAEMANLGLPVPPGFTITDRGLHLFLRQRQNLSDGAEGAGRDGAGPCRQARPARRFGDADNPLLVSVRSGAPRLDAGHDGHRAQSRPQRRDRARRWPNCPATRASPMTAIAASSRCIPTWCSASSIIISRTSSTTYKDGQGYHARHRSDRRRLGRAGRPLQGRGRAARPASLSRRIRTSSCGARSARCSSSWMNAARDDLSPPARHSGDLGHRRQRAGDGVRQHGRDLGDRRRLHPQSVDRREQALRRIPDQRAGRGRGRRHPHAAGHHRRRAQRVPAPTSRRWKRRCRRRSRSSTRIYDAAREALPRHAGHGVHGRAGQAVDAADPRRQAHRQGRAAHRGRTWPTKA